MANIWTDEWEKNHSVFQGDIYAKSLSDRSSSNLGKMLSFSESSNYNREILRPLLRKIKQANRSGSWLHWNKNASFNKLLSLF